MNVLKTLLLTVVITTFSLFVLPSFSKIEASVPAANWVWTEVVSEMPRGIAVDDEGNVYVAIANGGTADGNKIAKYDSDGNLLMEKAGYGSGNDTFGLPFDIDVDDEGNIYVVEEWFHRVKKFNSNFEWQWTIGGTSSGTAASKFNKPRNLAVDSDRNLLYVLDTLNDRIQVFNTSDGSFVRFFGTRYFGGSTFGFKNMHGIDIGVDGRIYVLNNSSSSNKRISIFDSSFNLIQEKELDIHGDCRDIALDSEGNIYITCEDNDSIYKYDSNWNFITKIGVLGNGDGQLSNPYGVAIDADDNIYVADTYNDRIQKFDLSSFEYQISGLDSSYDIFASLGSKINEGSVSGINSSSEVLSIKEGEELIAEIEVDMTSDRDWSDVNILRDLDTGKLLVDGLNSASGVLSPPTLYVYIPRGYPTDTVHFCPNATSLEDITDSCTDGVSLGEGSHSESFGEITINYNSTWNTPFWQRWEIEGYTGTGIMTEALGDPIEIATCSELQDMHNDLSGYYILTNNIDCSESITWNEGAGFLPIGDSGDSFKGTFDGGGYSISNLYIKGYEYMGLFGYTEFPSIYNFDLIDITYVIDDGYGYAVGGLIGEAYSTDIKDINISGEIYGGDSVEGFYAIGGLSGNVYDKTFVENCHVDVEITLNSEDVWDSASFIGWVGESVIIDSSASGNFVVNLPTLTYADIGGLGGFFGGARAYSISNSTSSGDVTINGYFEPDYVNGVYSEIYGVGGFGGYIEIDSILNCSSSSNVSVSGNEITYVGGFIGDFESWNNRYAMNITNSFSSGDIYCEGEKCDYVDTFFGGSKGANATNIYSLGNVTKEILFDTKLSLLPTLEDSLATSAKIDAIAIGKQYYGYTNDYPLVISDSKLTFLNGLSLIAETGSNGYALGQFKTPTDVDLEDDTCCSYVVDSTKDVLMKFSYGYSDGYKINLAWEVGRTGTLDGQFVYPASVVYNNFTEEVFVLDIHLNRIQVFDPFNGNFIRKFQSTDLLVGALRMDIDLKGKIYVLFPYGVKVFDSDFNYIRSYGEGIGSGLGEFRFPSDIAVSRNGTIFIADNDRIQRITENGEYLLPIDSVTTGGGNLDSVSRIALNYDESAIYISRGTVNSLIKYTFSEAPNHISNIDSSFDVVFSDYPELSVNSESGNSGVGSSNTPLLLKNTEGIPIAEVVVDMSEDRDWSSVGAGVDLTVGKAFVSNLTSAPGASATHTLYVPVPQGMRSSSVYICPDADNLEDVNESCSNGVEREEGDYSESFGEISITKEKNTFGNGRTYWKLEGLTGTGAMSSGLEEGLIPISSCTELQDIADNLSGEYEIVSAIDCSETSTWNGGIGFIPIGSELTPFSGNLNGNGYEISNIFLSSPSEEYIGLFGYVQNAEISNLNLTGFDLRYGQADYADYVGILGGYVTDSSISNVSVEGKLTQLGNPYVDYAGGLIGELTGNTVISNSSTDVEMIFSDNGNGGDGYGLYGIGGFIGYATDSIQISNSTSSGVITIDSIYGGNSAISIGGFIGDFSGYFMSEIDDCSSSIDIDITFPDQYTVAGFAGMVDDYATISNSFSTGKITSFGYELYDLAGFVGSIEGSAKIIDSYSTSPLTVKSTEVYDLGGFAGTVDNEALIQNSYSTGDIISTNPSPGDFRGIYQVGGFVGRLIGTTSIVEKSYSQGNVRISGYDYNYSIGGFVGLLDAGTIRQSMSSGSVLIPTSYEWSDSIGGFVGLFDHNPRDSIITDSFSRGNVFYSGGEAEGIAGFVGNANSYTDYQSQFSISNSYSTGTVINSYGTRYGFSDYASERLTVESSYWDVESSGISESSSGVGYTSNQLKNASNLTGWDFDDIWEIDSNQNDGYPIFQWQESVLNIFDSSGPSIYLDDVIPDLTPQTSITITGRAFDTVDIMDVQYQVDGLSGIWRNCTAEDGEYNSDDEEFICELNPLEEGEHTVFVRGINSLGGLTAPGQEAFVTFTIDTSQNHIEVIEESHKEFETNEIDSPGRASSIVLGPDGFPRISHIEGVSETLRLVICDDLDCVDSQEVIIDPNAIDQYTHTSLAIGSDGFARIAFRSIPGNLMFAKCNDRLCTNPVITDTGIAIAQKQGGLSLHIGSDDLARIGVIDNLEENINYIYCEDENCTDTTSVLIDTSNEIAQLQSVLGDSDIPYFVYSDMDTEQLVYAYCLDSSCSSVYTTNLVDVNHYDGDEVPGLVLDSEGLINFSYNVRNYSGLGIGRCLDIDCSEISFKEIYTVDINNETLPIILSDNDRPVVINSSLYEPRLIALSCLDRDCNNYRLFDLRNGVWTDKTYGKDAVRDEHGNVFVSYYNDTDYKLGFFRMKFWDYSPPEVTLDPIPSEITSRSYNVTGSSTDIGETVSGVHYQVDGYLYDGWIACSSDDGAFDKITEDFTCALEGLTNGEHTVYVRAFDSAGNATVYPNHATAIFSVNVVEEEETPVSPPTLPVTPSPKPKPTVPTQPPVTEEEIVEEETEEEIAPPVEEENEDIPPVSENEEDKEEKESIFVTISNGVKELASNIAKGISNVEVSKEVSESIAVTGIAVVSTHALLTNFVTLAGTQSLSSLQLLSSFFLIGGLKRKKNQKYSVVYDSVSKEPINMATVRVMDEMGKLVTTVVTDVYGVFDLKVPDGKYSFTVVSRNHSFPSQAVLGTQDLPYQNVYKGGLVEYSSNTGLNISIPMDKEEKGFLGVMFSSSRSAFVSILNILLKVLFVVGFGMTVISLVKEPSTLIWLSFGMYILLILLYVFFAYRDRRSFGVVRSTQGNMLEGLEIGVRELEFDTIYSKRVSDEKGKYRFILPGGKYRLEILNSNYELVDTPNDTFEIKDGSLFIVKEDIVVRRKV